jgi:hypothetical protein
LRFFFDNNLPIRLVRALRPLVEAAELAHLRELFRPDTPDEVWIPELAEQGGWVVVSGDIAIARNKVQAEIWRQSRMTGFFLAKGWVNITLMDQASRFIAAWPVIAKTAGRFPTGKVFTIQLNGRIHELKR